MSSESSIKSIDQSPARSFISLPSIPHVQSNDVPPSPIQPYDTPKIEQSLPPTSFSQSIALFNQHSYSDTMAIDTIEYNHHYCDITDKAEHNNSSSFCTPSEYSDCFSCDSTESSYFNDITDISFQYLIDEVRNDFMKEMCSSNKQGEHLFNPYASLAVEPINFYTTSDYQFY